jgi:hypothetical protein
MYICPMCSVVILKGVPSHFKEEPQVKKENIFIRVFYIIQIKCLGDAFELVGMHPYES